MIGVQGMDLVRSTTEILKQCELKQGDEVIVYADTGKAPGIVQSFYASALSLGVDPILAVFPQRRVMLQEPSLSALELMKKSTMVVDCATDPWLDTKGLNAVLDAGSRVLQVLAEEASLARMVPTKELVARAEAAARMFHSAKEVRIESAAGTNVTAD